MIYTVGHSNYPIESFVKKLNGLKLFGFVDVRSKPYSRYAPQYNKPKLKMSCEAEDIRYDWIGRSLGGLGTVSITNEKFLEGMDWLFSLADVGNVAICCMERHPHECHRATKLAEYIVQNTDRAVEHVTHDGELIDHMDYRPQIPVHMFWHELHEDGKYGK